MSHSGLLLVDILGPSTVLAAPRHPPESREVFDTDMAAVGENQPRPPTSFAKEGRLQWLSDLDSIRKPYQRLECVWRNYLYTQTQLVYELTRLGRFRLIT